MNSENNFASWEDAVQWLRSQPDQKQLVDDCYYDDPLSQAAERYWLSDEWQAVRDILDNPGGKKALDVGAGRGIASYALAKEGYSVSALEPDPGKVVGAEAIRSLAKDAGLPITVKEEFSEKLPFDDASFDLVFARAVLHHTEDLEQACSEFFRVLKPGGRLIAIREHVISKKDDLPIFLEQHPLHKLYGGENAFLLDEYISAIENAGFSELEVISPWKSPMNFAPYSLESLKQELSLRVGQRLPGLKGISLLLLNLPGIWPLIRRLLETMDHRPGRLYSFIAVRNT